MTAPLDNDRVEFLAKRFMGIVRSHYLEGPTGRDRVLEVLNALAVTVAFVLAGAGAITPPKNFSTRRWKTRSRKSSRARSSPTNDAVRTAALHSRR